MSDFDPAKVIIAIFDKHLGVPLPKAIKLALLRDEFDPQIAAALCEELNIETSSTPVLKSYADISDILVSTSECEGWFDDNAPLMGTNEVSVSTFSEIDGDFIYAEGNESVSLDDCYILTLYFPLVWEIDKYTGYRSKAEVLHCIGETASALLKDDIDWESRLGVLVGSIYG